MTRNRKTQTNDVVEKTDREGDLHNYHGVLRETQVIVQLL